MTPTPLQVPPTNQPTASPSIADATGWTKYVADLPKDITDAGYDSIREKYFYSNLAPQVLQNGHSLETVKDQWMGATAREKLSNYPRIETIATAAGQALTEPISAMSPIGRSHDIQRDINSRASDAASEAARQGINPWLYQQAGNLLGIAPYFAEGLMGPEALGEEAALKGLPAAGRLMTEGGKEVLSKEAVDALAAYNKSLITKATRAGAVGLVQGAYDAAIAPDGQKLQAGVQGLAAGTLLTGGLEGIGGLWGFLRNAHGLDADTAKAVEAVAKGVGTPKDEALATGAILKTTDIDKSIGDYVGGVKAQATKGGTPGDVQLDSTPTGDPKPNVFTTSGRIRIQMLGADGNTYHLGGAIGLKAEELDKINGRVVEHLNAGGSIQAINGDPALVNQTLNKLVEMNPDAFSLSNPIRSAIPDSGGVAAQTVKAPVESAEIKLPEEKIAAAGRFAVNSTDIPSYDKYVQLPSGEVLDKSTGEVHEDLAAAQNATRKALNPTPDLSLGGQKLYGIERGQANVPLSLNGRKQVAELGERISTKGGLDTLHMADLDRYRQTADGIMAGDKTVVPQFPNPALRSWNHGFEGQDQTPQTVHQINGLVDSPNSRAVSVNGRAESFNEFDKRLSRAMDPILQQHLGDPERKIGVVTSSRDIGLLRSKVTGGDFKTMQENPASVYRLHHEPSDTVRLYRVDSRGGKPVPSWMLDDPDFKSIKDATGRWFTADPDHLNWYLADAGKDAKISAVDIPKANLEKYRVANQSQDVKQFSARHDEEFFLPKDLAKSRQVVDPNELPDHVKAAYLPTDRSGQFVRPEGPFMQPPNSGKWNIRAHDMEADAQLPGGVYLIRHGETPWNKSARELQFKDTPLSRRYVGQSEMTPTGIQGQEVEFPGSKKPTIFYRDPTDKAVVFHENLHGHFGALDMHDTVADVMNDKMTDQIYNSGFSPASRDLYGDDPYIYREEVYAHGADAIRTNNEAKIQAFADADDGHDHYLNWMTEKTNQLLDHVAEKDDSLHKRTAERRLTSVVTRATNSITDIHNIFSQVPEKLDFDHGQYVLREGDRSVLYASREDALQELDKQGEPLNSPELIPLDRIPGGVTRYSRNVRPMANGERPNITDPPNPALNSDALQARGGLQLASRFFRPFNDWIATVAQKNSWPELYNAFAPLDGAQVKFNNLVRPYFKELQQTLGTLPESRQKDLMKVFLKPDDDFIKQELRVSPDEEAMLDRVRSKVLDPLGSQFGYHLDDYVNDMLSKIKAAGDDWRPAIRDDKNFMAARLSRGSLDPNEDNLAKLTAKYLEFGAWDQHIGPAVKAAEEVVHEKLSDDTLRAGNLAPLLQRHIDYLRGQPDYTGEIIKGAMEGAVDLINKGMDKLGLDPKHHLDEIAEDPLGKYTLFMYAGALAMKPATIIRDGLQLLLTTYPVAGKYTFRGMEKAFGAFDKAKAEELWRIPQQYGALIERNDLKSLYDGSVEEPTGSAAGPGLGSRLEKGAEKAANFGMRSIQLTHNGNRLTAFWGHSEQVLDALDTYRTTGDTERFTRDSGMWFMSPSMRDSFLKEIPTLAKADHADFSYRAAKELTELSQWNFKRGANPGLYEYQLGRLFGQYGTWPLNYIEYGRRLAAAGDGKSQAAALTRLALAHGAVLAAGQGMGVDTGRWVFTGPMAYEGGPLFNAVTHAADLPKMFDQDQEGEDARHNLGGIIPGADRLIEAKDLFTDIASGEPHSWAKILGFHEMHSGGYNHGLHQYLPKEGE